MLRHPRHMDIPWEIHWHPEGAFHRHRWLMLFVILAALLLIGVGVTSGRW